MSDSKLLSPILLFIFLVTSTTLWGQKKIDSYKKYPKSSFYIINTKSAAKDSLRAADIILSFKKKGYINCSVDTIEFKQTQTILHISKGIQYTWCEVTLSPFYNSSLSKPKGYFTYSKLENLKKEALQLYKENGYPMVVMMSNIYFENNIVNVNIEAAPGELFYFDSIKTNLPNNKSTNYIHHISNIKPKKLYNEKLLSELDQKINATGIYSLIDYNVEYLKSNKTSVILDIRETYQNSFSGFVGIQQNNDKKSNITGNVNIQLVNQISKGEKLSVEWKKTDATSQMLKSSVNAPFLFNSPLGFDGSINIDKQDSSFTTTDIDGGIEFYLGKYGFLNTHVQFVQSIVNKSTEQESGSYKSNLYGINYKYKRVDNFYNASKGVGVNINFAAGNRTLKKSIESSKTIRIDYNSILKWYIPVSKFSIMLQNRTSGIFTDSLQKSEMLRVGGFQWMRGFNENEIYAQHLSINTIEIKYILNTYSNIYFLMDYGLFVESPELLGNANQRWAAGAGLNLNTKAGILSITYALGKSKNESFILNNAKIHIGYINRF